MCIRDRCETRRPGDGERGNLLRRVLFLQKRLCEQLHLSLIHIYTLFMAGLFINVNYIVVPIFLMLRDGDVWLKSHFGSSFLLNNLVVLAVV